MEFVKKKCLQNKKAISCDACNHSNCNCVKDKEYCQLQEQGDDIPWFCLPCEISKNAELFPFGLESNLDENFIHTINSLYFSLFELSKLSKAMK